VLLGGRIVFNDDDIGIVEYKVKARDSLTELKIFLDADNNDYSNYTKALSCFDKASDDGVVSHPYSGGREYKDKLGNTMVGYLESTRRLDIKKTNKYKSNITNKDLALKISAIIRYMQITGVKNYNQKVDSDFSPVREVEIDGVGVVKYSMGIITELICSNKFVYIELKSINENLDVEIFKSLKDKDSYGNILSIAPIDIVGFKLTESILGFKFGGDTKNDAVSILGMFSNMDEVISNSSGKDFKWIKGRKYNIVDQSNLDEAIGVISSHDGLVAFDTETTGLDINFKSRSGEANQLVGVAISIKKGTGYYFPLQHKMFDNLCDGDHWYFMEKYMRPILEKKKIICHNVKFDWKVAYIYGINVNCIYDTMLAFGVTKRYEEENFELALKGLVKNILGFDMLELDDFVQGSSFSDSGITFADLPYELVRQYAPADADMTLSLYEFIEENDLINKYDAKRVFDLEVDFAKAVAYSEFYGYHIDVDRVQELQSRIETSIENISKEMYKIVGREFNPRSPKQLSKIMYEELGGRTD